MAKKKPDNAGKSTEIIRDEKGRFKKGTSGNPQGKPPGATSLLAKLREKLDKIPKGERQSIADLLLDRYLDDAWKLNDGVVVRDLIDRIDGKPHQTITVDNEKDAQWFELAERIAGRIKPKTGNDSN